MIRRGLRHLLLLLLASSATFGSAVGWSCISSNESEWRLCQPEMAAAPEEGCRCHSVVVSDKGDSGCQSTSNKVPFCYVIDELSECDDKKPSSKSEGFSQYWNWTIAVSEAACNGNSEGKPESPDIGNAEILPGIEIVGDDPNFFKTFRAGSHVECQEQCSKRFFCRSWTFVDGEPGICQLRGQSSCCGQNQRQKQNPQATSGFECNKKEPGFVGSWSTHGKCLREPSFEMSEDWKQCQSENKLLWLDDNSCYNATERGPCEPHQWLILRDDLEESKLESICADKPCLGEEDSDNCNLDPSESPECAENGDIIFNSFGHPICICEQNTYRLVDPFTYSQEEAKKCYSPGAVGPCPDGEKLYLVDVESSDILSLACMSVFNPAAHSVFDDTFFCRRGYVYAFGRCVRSRRRSNG